jgi:hypothetical protein
MKPQWFISQCHEPRLVFCCRENQRVLVSVWFSSFLGELGNTLRSLTMLLFMMNDELLMRRPTWLPGPNSLRKVCRPEDKNHLSSVEHLSESQCAIGRWRQGKNRSRIPAKLEWGGHVNILETTSKCKYMQILGTSVG